MTDEDEAENKPLTIAFAYFYSVAKINLTFDDLIFLFLLVI